MPTFLDCSRSQPLAATNIPADTHGQPIPSLRYHLYNGSPQLGRNLRPPVNDCPQVCVDFPLRKQARNKLWVVGDWVYPFLCCKCLPFLDFFISPGGKRTIPVSASKTPISPKRGTESGTPNAGNTPLDPDLAKIVQAWPRQPPEAVRSAVLAIVRNAIGQ
jgi:hypothetical protein